MDNLYSNDIRQYFQSRQWPKGLKAFIAEEEHNLNLVLFRDNFNSFDGEDRLQIAMMVKEFMEKVRGMGVPIYMQVARGDGCDE